MATFGSDHFRSIRAGRSVAASIARMSGTAYGTAVLHVAPESAVGGSLALVQDGDEIELDVGARDALLRWPIPRSRLRP